MQEQPSYWLTVQEQPSYWLTVREQPFYLTTPYPPLLRGNIDEEETKHENSTFYSSNTHDNNVGAR